MSALLTTACGRTSDPIPAVAPDTGVDTDASGPDVAEDLVPDVGPTCGTRAACAATWEENASARLEAILADPSALAAFLKAVPKGGDLHNHLNGAVYAETMLEWARADGDCVDTTKHTVYYGKKCTETTQPAPSEGDFFDEVIRAWSMQDFVPGDESGHDHFFATFGKYGTVSGAHRDESIADVLARAADENQVYVETMFNMGKNVGKIASSLWSGTLTAADLPAFYDLLVADPGFAAALDTDVAVVGYAVSGTRDALGCADLAPPPACDVGVRFISQVSRTGASDLVFGQLVASFEMAIRTPDLVGVNLSSAEDETTSLSRYALHMAMLDFLYEKYTATGVSPLHVTLHAGELTPKFLPEGFSDANTFHVRDAVEVAHAERIGHGIDVLSETDPEGLMAEMREKNVLVEVCLSSNAQILEVSGENHPLAQYLSHDVPVTLATDDQGVSRSSMAGEYLRAVQDQKLNYRQLKRMARESLEHAFLPGTSLWLSLPDALPVAECAPTDAFGVGDPPVASCDQFLATSERAQAQWELERRFVTFESLQ